jgi:hypothetical protein
MMHGELQAKGMNWLHKLPPILWSQDTNPSRATRATPFHPKGASVDNLYKRAYYEPWRYTLIIK